MFPILNYRTLWKGIYDFKEKIRCLAPEDKEAEEVNQEESEMGEEIPEGRCVLRGLVGSVILAQKRT